jgi:polyphenol oxidase
MILGRLEMRAVRRDNSACSAATTRPMMTVHLVQLMIGIIVAAAVLNIGGDHGAARAEPVRVPDLRQCSLATDKAPRGDPTVYYFNCCLPYVPPSKVVQFSLDKYPPPANGPRVRHPAHRVGADYVAKYNKAYELMKALPDTDPRSFKVQADLHCAFCNGAYRQGGAGGDKPLQVHFSWLFLPWHRMYLYFHERILAGLLGDPSFALVYWNWDDQRDGGNVLPPMFAANGTALYDANRNPAHTGPSALVRLSPASTTTNDSVIVAENLNAMYQALVTANTPELFLGGPYILGSDLTNATVLSAPLGGSIENAVHNGIHYWTGSRTLTLGMDMGTFTTASRDPVFYAHHGNVDRLWNVWRFHLPDGERYDYTNETDFLDAEFAFFDEHANRVSIKVRDVLDIGKLGYRYKRVSSDKLWARFSPLPVSNGSALAAALAAGVPLIGASPLNGTIDLGSRLVARVERPYARKASRPEHSNEVLTIQGLDVVRDSFMQIVAFVNLPNATNTTATSSAEYVGTFNIVPSASKHNRLVTNVKFEIGDNLKRVAANKDDEAVVTIVVKGVEKITIQGLLIAYEV